MIFRALFCAVLLLPLALSACGDLPEPFIGNPGEKGRQLSAPPVPSLAIPPLTRASLDPGPGGDFADLLALSLQKDEIPTLAREPRKTDWRLVVTADRRGDLVVPHYAIQDPTGREQGAVDGATVSASAWTLGDSKTLGVAAKDAVPKIVALMMSIRATRDRADPNSLLHRVAKLYVPEVVGAPGDGNYLLTKTIRARLAEFGPLVQLTPENADFFVKGEVSVKPVPKAKQQVEITWTVTRPSGVVAGKVSQLNSVASGSLDQYWGDVALVVAQEAAGGVDRVVERFVGRDPNAAAGTAKDTSGASSPTPAQTTPATGKPPVPGQAAELSAPPAAAKPAGIAASAPVSQPAVSQPAVSQPAVSKPAVSKLTGAKSAGSNSVGAKPIGTNGTSNPGDSASGLDPASLAATPAPVGRAISWEEPAKAKAKPARPRRVTHGDATVPAEPGTPPAR